MTPSNLDSMMYHRTAIALNNMSITLMERHEYRDALDTVNDAMVVVKKLSGMSHDRKPRQQQQDSASAAVVSNSRKRVLDRMVKAASKRLAASRFGDVVVEDESASAPLGVIPHGDHDLSGLRSSLLRHAAGASPCSAAPGPSSAATTSPAATTWTAFPIRLDDRVSCGGDHYRCSSDDDIEFAIIKYNFAVAQMCASTSAKKESTRRGLVRGACNVLDIAATALRHRNLVETCKHDAVQEMRRLLVSAVVLSTRASLASGADEDGDEPAAAPFSAELALVTSAIGDLENDPRMVAIRSMSSVSAPAA